jgi:hypothetical protein
MPVPVRHALFVITDAAIDQNVVVWRLDQPGMHAGDDAPTGFITMVGIKPVPMFFEDFYLVIREEPGWVK